MHVIPVDINFICLLKVLGYWQWGNLSSGRRQIKVTVVTLSPLFPNNGSCSELVWEL